MKSFMQVVEEFAPKFQRATKTDAHYTGQINGKTYVVPHAFHGNHDVLHGTKVTPIRHAIVVSPTHVQHNNPSLSPEEVARVHSHIKAIHGGQDPKRLGNLDESWLPMRGPRASKETPEVNDEHAQWEKAHAPATRRELKAARGMRTGAADRFLRRYGQTNEERQLALHLGMKKSDSHAPKPAPVVKKPVRVASTKSAEEKEAEHQKYRNAALLASRKATTLEFARKHHIIKESSMKKPMDLFSHHHIEVAKKTLRMPDAMVGVMGGINKEESRRILREKGWTDKQIHKHEHAQFVSEHVWKVTDHLGHTHEVEAKDHDEAKKKTVSVGGVHPQGIPMTQWGKVRIERKNLEEKTLTPAETAKKEELVHKMKPKLQGFKDRYGKDAKGVMYATATKQAKKLAEGIEPLDESFMGIYTRNENANRHTANIVHLAKHFGDAADQAQAKFYAAELKKHGHNIHHEAQYKLHEKLFPKALAAHHMKEATEQLDEKNWIAGAIKRPGALHRALHVPQGEKIPAGKLEVAAHKKGKVGSEARLAKTLKSFHKEEHPDTFNTVKRVLGENYMQDRRFQGGYEIPHSTHTEYHAWGQVTHHSDAEAKAARDAKAKEWKQQGHKVTKHRSTNAIYDPDGPFTTSGTVYTARKHHAQ